MSYFEIALILSALNIVVFICGILYADWKRTKSAGTERKIKLYKGARDDDRGK